MMRLSLHKSHHFIHDKVRLYIDIIYMAKRAQIDIFSK